MQDYPNTRLEDDDDEEEKEPKDGEFLGRGLIKTRTILISDSVDHKLTARVTAQLLFLDSEDAEAPIKIFINSPGGSADDGFAIYDMIRFVRPAVKIISTGLSASAATVIMLAATKENRLATPNARIMIHQPWGGVQGQATDISIQAQEILRLKDRLNGILAKHTGKELVQLEQDTDRDKFLSAEDAKEYGLVDSVVEDMQRTEGKYAPRWRAVQIPPSVRSAVNCRMKWSG